MSTIQNELQKFAQWLDMVRNTNDPLWRNMSIWGNNNAYQLMLINFHNDFPMEQRDLEGSPSAGVEEENKRYYEALCILYECLQEAPVDFLGTGSDSKHASNEEQKWNDKWQNAFEAVMCNNQDLPSESPSIPTESEKDKRIEK